MPFVTTTDGVEIFYKDWGSKDARPIMFKHGWPLSSDDWDAQLPSSEAVLFLPPTAQGG